MYGRLHLHPNYIEHQLGNWLSLIIIYYLVRTYVNHIQMGTVRSWNHPPDQYIVERFPVNWHLRRISYITSQFRLWPCWSDLLLIYQE